MLYLNGQAYLPAGGTVDTKGERYMRYFPCLKCYVSSDFLLPTKAANNMLQSPLAKRNPLQAAVAQQVESA